MPLIKLQFRPGVNREATSLANEGGWFDCNNIRFRSGYPEKIGGWVADTGITASNLKPPTGSYWGVCRNLWAWLNLIGYELLGLGTNLKYYIQQGANGAFYDVTPLSHTSSGTATFGTTASSTKITVTDTSNSVVVNDFVTFSGVTTTSDANITPAILNAEFQVVSVISTSQYTIKTTVAAAGTHASVVTSGTVAAAYQINTGLATFTVAQGWGGGGWGGVNSVFASTGWGASSSGVGIEPRLWNSANYGQDLIINPSGGAMYYWANVSSGAFNRAVLLGAGQTITTESGNFTVDATCPSLVNYIIISDASDFVITLGCNDPSGLVTGTSIDPMLVRWSDQQNIGIWSPTATNQAGSYRLSQGSQIVTAIQTRQEILIWTDSALYAMQYLGAPYVYGFQIMGENISIMSPNAAISVNNITYWMGLNKFYMYNGTVQTLPCAVRQYIFNNINFNQNYQVCCGSNEAYNEVWWFYCSSDASLTDSYVIYNYLDQTWAYGSMPRGAWLYTPLRQVPISTNYAGQLIYQETGVDDGTTNPASAINAYIQSSDFDIGDGNNFGFIYRCVPDINFTGSYANNPSVNMTFLPRQNPGAAYGQSNNPSVTSTQNYLSQREYIVQQFTQQIYTRARGRQMAFKMQSTSLGVQWQAGVQRLDIRPDGRR